MSRFDLAAGYEPVEGEKPPARDGLIDEIRAQLQKSNHTPARVRKLEVLLREASAALSSPCACGGRPVLKERRTRARRISGRIELPRDFCMYPDPTLPWLGFGQGSIDVDVLVFLALPTEEKP